MEVTLASVNEAINFISQLKAMSIATQDLKIIINDNLSEETSKNRTIEKSLNLKAKPLQTPINQIKSRPLDSNLTFTIPNISDIEKILNKDRFTLVKNRMIELANNGSLSIDCSADDIRANPARILQHYFHTTRYHGKSVFSVWEKNSLIVEVLKDDKFLEKLSNLLLWDQDFVSKLLKTSSKRGKPQLEESSSNTKISPLNARIGYKIFEKHVKQLIQKGKLPPQREDTPKFNDYLIKISKISLPNTTKNFFWMWQSLGQIKPLLDPEITKKICKTFYLSEQGFIDIVSNQPEKKIATS